MAHNPQIVGFKVPAKLIKFFVFPAITLAGIGGFLIIKDLPKSQSESRETISQPPMPPPPAYIILRRGEEIRLTIRESEWTPWLNQPDYSQFDLKVESPSEGTLVFGFPNGKVIESHNRNTPLGRLPDQKFHIRGLNQQAKLLVFP